MCFNVKGVFGKLKLDEKRIGYIRHQTFELFPVKMTENEQKCWASCVQEIDSASRQLN